MFAARLPATLLDWGTTIAVMHIFKAAQPALLYIVPTVIGFPAVHSLLQGEFKQVWFSPTDFTKPTLCRALRGEVDSSQL